MARLPALAHTSNFSPIARSEASHNFVQCACLTTRASEFGTRGSPGFIEACDVRGAVLPFPYGTGAGYLFSRALLQFVASSPEVTGWVADAAGSHRLSGAEPLTYLSCKPSSSSHPHPLSVRSRARIGRTDTRGTPLAKV